MRQYETKVITPGHGKPEDRVKGTLGHWRQPGEPEMGDCFSENGKEYVVKGISIGRPAATVVIRGMNGQTNEQPVIPATVYVEEV